MNYLIPLFCLALCSAPAVAETATPKYQGNMAVHIAQMHYEHPTRLMHPYLDVWHMKGPLAQKVALATLSKRFEHVQWCNQAKHATLVLQLEPHMFYNPQLKVFHAEIIAKAYTQSGGSSNLEPAMLKIKKQAQQVGDLNATPAFYMEKAYVKAMDKVIAALEKDAVFVNSLQTTQAKQVETICPALDELPVSKLYY